MNARCTIYREREYEHCSCKIKMTKSNQRMIYSSPSSNTASNIFSIICVYVYSIQMDECVMCSSSFHFLIPYYQ